LVAVILIGVGLAWAHDPLRDLPAPTSAGEAWNVIRLSMGNIETCLETNQPGEVAIHVANCSRAIRFLQGQAKVEGKGALVGQLEELYYSGDAIITGARQKEDAVGKAKAALAAHRAALKAVMGQYGLAQLSAEVYACPMHPLERSLDAKGTCPKCGMALIRRRIPASTTYEKPGAPSMKLMARTDRPLQVGRDAKVTLRLTKNDGTPVARGELLTMHTQKIHLLIVDASLGDYHHEHPGDGEGAGEYVFAFTPKRPGAYRVFADVVPAGTGVQEYVVADIAGEGKGNSIEDRQERLSCEIDGMRFDLRLAGPVRAGSVVEGQLVVSGRDGKPFKSLEPVMGAFAHVVAFNEDRRTVLHVHPEGPEVTDASARGGSVLRFKLYAPVAGFYRLYAQTQISGEARFAPFNLTVLSADDRRAAP
jgi:hypothetical protein